MTQPTPYNKSRTFADSSTGVVYPVPASFLDTEFTLVETTVDEICTNLALIQRDDGLLANQSVHPDALNEAVTLMMGDWNPRGDWVTGRKYAKHDMARQGGLNYVAVSDHLSGVFSTDLAAGYWQALGTPNSLLQTQIDEIVGNVDDLQDSIAAFELPTRAALRLYQGPSTTAKVVARITFGDGGGGTFSVKAGDTTTPDDGVFTIVDALGRRWHRDVQGGVYHLEWADVVQDFNGTIGTDASAALLLVCAKAAAAGGGIVKVSGRYYLGASVDLTAQNLAGVRIEGVSGSGEILPDGTWGSPTGAPHRFDYTRINSGFFMEPTATIRLANRCHFRDLFVVTPDTATPATDIATAASRVAAFSGTALEVGGSDVVIEGVAIYGFNLAIKSSGFERFWFERVYGDCTNGIDVRECTDTGHIARCWFEPYYSTGHNSALTGSLPLIRRQGTGIKLHDRVDAVTVSLCLTYGYDIGLHLDGTVNHVFAAQITSCIFDNNLTNSATSLAVGVKTEGALIGCHLNGIHVDSSYNGYDFGHSGLNVVVVGSDLTAGQVVNKHMVCRAGSAGMIANFHASSGCASAMEFLSGISNWQIGSINLANCTPSGTTFLADAADIAAGLLKIGSIAIKGGTATDNLRSIYGGGQFIGSAHIKVSNTNTPLRLVQNTPGTNNLNIELATNAAVKWEQSVRTSVNDDLWFYNVGRADPDLILESATGTVRATKGIQTGDPPAGAAGLWRLGSYKTAAVALNTGNYVEISIGGVLYKLAVVT